MPAQARLRSRLGRAALALATAAGALSCGGADADEACTPTTSPGGGGGVVVASAGGFSVRLVDVSPSPLVAGKSSLRIALANDATGPLRDSEVHVSPYMPEHGHGSALVPVVTHERDGVYVVSDLYLPMVGVWSLTVTSTTDALTRGVSFDVCVGRAD